MKTLGVVEARQSTNVDDSSSNLNGGQFDDLMEAEHVLRALSDVFLPARGAGKISSEWVGESSGEIASDQERIDVKDRYRILVEQVPAIVFMAYLDRGIGEAYVSPQIEALLGFTREEWMDDPIRWYAHIHSEDKSRWSADAAHMLLTGEPLRSIYRVIARDGGVIWFQCDAKMVRGLDGRPWFIHGTAFDITEMKRAEEALRDSEEMQRGLFEFAPDTVLVVNQDGRIERVNSQVEHMFGYRRQELVGKHYGLLLPGLFLPELVDHRDPHIDDQMTRPVSAGLELYGRRKDESEFPVDIMLSPIKAPQGELVIAVIRDVTVRKQAQEALVRREEELRALTASLLSVQDEERRRIARELHDGAAQTLTALALNLSLLLKAPAMLAEDSSRRILSESLTLAEQCSREVRNLSYLLHPPLLDDLGLATALKSYVGGFSQRTRIDVELELPTTFGRLTPEVETALFRIVQEGLANIHRHSGSSKAAIRLAVTEDEVRLIVEDEGRGNASKIADEGASGPVRLGVGIPGMRERAKQLGGRMEFDSDCNGTMVTVTLPIRSE